MDKYPSTVYAVRDDKHKVFRTTPFGVYFIVTDYKDGVVTIDAFPGERINTFINVVVSFFQDGSNFGTEVAKAFNAKEPPYEVYFNFNGAEVVVTYENADSYELLRDWEEKMNEVNRKNLEHYHEIINSPEYKKKKKEELKRRVREQKIQEDMKVLDRKTQLEFKNPEARAFWQHLKRKQKVGYDREIINYSRRWAKYMQYLMSKYGGITIFNIADSTSFAADTNGITGAQFTAAVAILAHVWSYGDELKGWYEANYL